MKKYGLLISIIILAFIFTGCNRDDSTYADAGKLMEEGNFLEAAQIYDTIVEYEDSAEKSKECKLLYAKSIFSVERVSEIDDETREESFGILYELGDYSDAYELLCETKYQYAAELYEDKKKKEAEAIWIEFNEYKDCQQLFADKYLNEAEWVFISLSYKNNKQRVNEFDEIIRRARKEADFVEILIYDLVYEYAVDKFDSDMKRSLDYLDYLRGKGYEGADTKYDELYEIYYEEEKKIIAENFEEAERQREETATANSTDYIMCDIGETYTDKTGLQVTLNSFVRSGNTFIISYTITNNTDTVVVPGTFKLFFTDDTGLQEYGIFPTLSKGQSWSREYAFDVENPDIAFILEYNEDNSTTGSDSFFRKKPIANTFHWAIP